MEPINQYSYTSPNTPINQKGVFGITRILIAIVILIILIVIFKVISDSRFRIVSVSPDPGSITTGSSDIKISFNKNIKSNVKLSSDYSIVQYFSTSDKTLTVYFNVPLVAKRNYYIKIISIADTKGKMINNKVYNFTPSAVSFNTLTKSQQQALLKEQANKSVERPNVSNVNFTGTDGLTNNGFSPGQVSVIEQDIFNFDNKAKLVSINSGSVQPVGYNPNTSTSITFDFNLTIDSIPYKATASFTSTSNMDLTLYDQSGASVYNSGVTQTVDSD